MAEFTTPDFLRDHGLEEVFRKMKMVLPSDIDLSEGGHGWNMTRPTALVAAELCEFILPEVIKLIFPEWSYGSFLDAHAKSIGLTRREATAATGVLKITGKPGTVIPSGTIFSTAAVNGNSVDYKVVRTSILPISPFINGDVSVYVEVQCTQAGTIGNTPMDTIVLMPRRIIGITSVTNPEAVTGGTEEEDDEALIERIMEYEQSQGDSFTGSVADYKRWALSVPGVGSATVIPPSGTTGLVTIIITDANGAPATQKMCEDVNEYIMAYDHPEARLAPINANILVRPPDVQPIMIKAKVELTEGATLEAVTTAYAARLAAYLPDALESKEIKYTRLAAALSATEGVNDYSDLEFCVKDGETSAYGTSNITIATDDLPTIDVADIILTAGGV